MKTDDKVLIGIGIAFVGLIAFLALKKADNGQSLLAKAATDVKNQEA